MTVSSRHAFFLLIGIVAMALIVVPFRNTDIDDAPPRLPVRSASPWLNMELPRRVVREETTLNNTTATFNLHGNVVDALGNPLTEALILAEDDIVYTDSSGDFALRLAVNQTHALRARKGILIANALVNVGNDDQYVSMIARPGKTIHLKVVDYDTSSAIRGAKIHSPGAFAETDAEGTATIVGTFEGEKFEVSATGYEDVDVYSNGSSDLSVRTVKLLRGNLVEGQIVDEIEQPIRNAVITAYNDSLDSRAGQAKSDEQGGWQFRALSDSPHTFEISLDGLSHRVSLSREQLSARRGIVIRVVRPLVTGYVRDENNAAVPQATVYSSDGQVSTTDNNGQFRLRILSSGVSLWAKDGAKASRLVGLRNNLVEDIHVRDTKIVCYVLDSLNKPVAGAEVTVVTGGFFATSSASTNGDGRVQFDGVPLGAYQILGVRRNMGEVPSEASATRNVTWEEPTVEVKLVLTANPRKSDGPKKSGTDLTERR